MPEQYWRKPNPHDGSNMMKKVFRDVPGTRLFDNLYFIGNDMYGAFIISTCEGLIMVDCMEPGFMAYMEQRIVECGLDPKDLKAIIITHGHGDHYGDAGLFRDKYGCRIYMSEVDEQMALDPANAGPGRGPMPFRCDGYLVPGEDFVLGDQRVSVFSTAGHTPGTVSFIFTVYDCGVPHLCMIWGGTGPNREVACVEQQLRSVDYFDWVCRSKGVDTEVGNHPFTDNLVVKMELLREIVDGVPHPLIIGQEGVHSLMMMYKGLYVEALEKRRNGDMSSNFAGLGGKSVDEFEAENR